MLSFVLLVWQWLAARRYPLHERIADSAFAPPVTVLKPLKWVDSTTADSLRSWFTQDYPGDVQLLLGVDSESDPVYGVVRQLLTEFPQHDAKIVICSELLGLNPKVSKLLQMEHLAKHEILVVSDADVYAPPDLLLNVVARLGSGATERAGEVPLPALFDNRRSDASSTLHSATNLRTASDAKKVGLVNCFYVLANPVTAPMRLEAVAVNVDFWSQVLQARSLGELDFALGAVMCVRREALVQIGGFAVLADYLADDYQLGNKIARAGWQIALCPVVVECRSAPLGWRAVWRHQIRWARTIRVCKPVPYFFSILSNATVWPILWFIANPRPMNAGLAGAMFLIRIFAAFDLMRFLTRARPGNWLLWAVPLKDIFLVVIWLFAFIGNGVEWHGHRFSLVSDGKLIRLK